MLPFQRLEAWRVAHALVLGIYRATATWPREEQYGLVGQTRRAAVSVPSNIAEGSAKRGPRELRRYLDISLGSLSELAYLLLVSNELGYLSNPEYSTLDSMRDHTGRLVWGLYRKVSWTDPPG